MREERERERRAKLVEEIWEASERGDFSEMHRLSIQYQANGRGPQKRYYFTPKTHWTKATWEEELANPPEEGGLGA
eukprot:2634849-Pyramimonas_sp.AAC.1